MTNSPVDATLLLDLWAELSRAPPGGRLLRSRRLEEPRAMDLRAAVREPDGAACLVVAAGEADTAAIATFETGGLRLARARDEAGVLLVLSLEEPSRRDLFAQVCADVVGSTIVAEAAGETDLMRAMAARLAAWRAFLRDQSGGLSRNELVGLLGELFFLEILAGLDPGLIEAWRAPDDGLHDFERDGRAVEVKTSLGPATRMRASNLDQFDPSGVASLHIAHVRLVEDPAGERIVALAIRIAAALPTDRLRRAFENALLRRGLPPDSDGLTGPSVRLDGVEAYEVAGDFPRLIRVAVPAGIVEASYEIETRSLAPYAIVLADVLQGLATA